MKTLMILALLAAPSWAGLESMKSELPRRTSGGAYTGSLSWGRAEADARLEQFGKHYVLAMRPPVARLIQFGRAQGLDKTPLADLDIKNPVLLFSPAEMRVQLGAEQERYYGVRVLNLKRGINLVARAQPRPGSGVARFLDTHKLRIRGLVIEGVILRDFDMAKLKEAKQQGRLRDALRKGTMLTVRLGNVQLGRLPKGYALHDAYFYMTGEPGFGVGATLVTPKRRFRADLGMRRAGNGTLETILTASHRGRWNDAFGIPGFHVDGGTFLFSMDATQQISIGVRTTMLLGRKRVGVAGKLTMHAVTGVTTNLMVQGRISSLGSADLVAVANGITKSSRRHNAAVLPEFALRNVSFRYAPLGGDARLGIDSGVALKGTLWALNRDLAHVDGMIDATTKPATMRLHGKVADFTAGPVSLRNAAVALQFGARGNPYFRLRGQSRMWITRKSVDVNVNARQMWISVSDKVGGVYAAHYQYQSRNGRSWHGSVSFRNDLSRTLERDVSRRANAWAKQAGRDFAKAQQDLNREIAKVKQLDRQIAAARRQVHAERSKAIRDLQAAERKVKQLDGEIRARKKWIYDKQMAVWKSLQWHQRNVKNKHTAWQNAIKATKRAKVWDKPKYKAREAKAWSAYHAAGVSRDAKRVEYDLLRKQVDVKLKSLQAARHSAVGVLKAAQWTYRKVTGGVSVDADPRVATLFARRDTAIAALKIAKGAVAATGKAAQGAARVTAWAAKHNGKLLMVDSASISGGLGTSLHRTGGRMSMRVRFLGKRHTLKLNVNLEQVRRGIHAIVWREVKRLARV